MGVENNVVMSTEFAHTFKFVKKSACMHYIYLSR